MASLVLTRLAVFESNFDWARTAQIVLDALWINRSGQVCIFVW